MRQIIMRIPLGAGKTRPAAGRPTAGLCAAALLTAAIPAVALGAVAAGGHRARFPASPCELPFSQGEWATANAVALRLSRPPAAGQRATVAIGVCARHAGPVRVRIVLPDGFSWARPPAGMTISRRASRDPASFGCLTWASGTWELTAMRPLRLSATIIASKTGHAALTASAALIQPGAVLPDGSDSVFTTVGPAAASSHFGWRSGSVSLSATVPSASPLAPSCR